jgi:hypothetical protein
MPKFDTIARYAAEGCLVKPLFHQFILDPSATTNLNLLVERPMPRQPDGWFHASQHPRMSERDLYLWMTGQSEPEEMDYKSLMSVFFGTLGHAVNEAFLDWMGVSVPLPPGDCPACGRPRRALRARPSSRYCTEHGAVHEPTRARCHLDAILDFDRQNHLGLGWQRTGIPLPHWHGYDFKTIYPMGLGKVRDMDLDAFREKWPHYWCQMQECMRITGLRRYIVFFLSQGFPWDTREFHIPFDPEFAAETEAKYLAVLSHVERKVPIVAL